MTSDEIIEQLKTGRKLLVNKCSVCDYLCGYAFNPQIGLFYDAGCWCSMRPPESRNEDDINRMVKQNPDFDWKFV